MLACDKQVSLLGAQQQLTHSQKAVEPSTSMLQIMLLHLGLAGPADVPPESVKAR